MKKPLTKLSTSELKKIYTKRRAEIRSRLREFKNIPSSDYFYELVYCLLTPQSSAVNAGKAVCVLREHNFQNTAFDPELYLHQKDYYIRFHKTKAKHLLHVKEQFSAIEQHLANGNSSNDLREWLAMNVRGLGWKEASHFLRNIGHRNLAILDRHILKNLIRIGTLKSLPKTLTAKHYKRIEKKFQTFSLNIGIDMDELDLLFWSMETGEILK